MKTIVFHSYKGGVGRTLALANLAHALAKLGKRVVMLDFDFSAPGLHFKFSDPEAKVDVAVVRGYVDYLHDMVHEPGRLEGEEFYQLYKTDIASRTEALASTMITVSDSLKLVPAGDSSSPEYWQCLAAQWFFKYFYFGDTDVPADRISDSSYCHSSEEFFRQDKEVFAQLFSPEPTDYLLVDCKTGNEQAAVPLMFWADIVVSFFPKNREGVFGAALIRHAVQQQRNAAHPRFIQVVCRVPEGYTDDDLNTLRNGEFMDSWHEISRDADAPTDAYCVLHEQRALETAERLCFLLVDPNTDDSKTRLCHDYVELFAKIADNDEALKPYFADSKSRKQSKILLGLAEDVELIERYFQRNLSTGELINADSQPNVSFRTETLRGLIISLIQHQLNERTANKIAKKQAWKQIDTVLRTTGQIVGRNFAMSSTSMEGTVDDRFRKWCEFDSSVGFGKMTHAYDAATNSGTVWVRNGFLLQGSDGQQYGSHLNQFMAGYIEGVVEGLLSQDPHGSLAVQVAIRDTEAFHFTPKQS